MTAITEIDIDPFDESVLKDQRAYHSVLREAPMVWLTRYGIWASGRHAEVSAIFKDYKTFCSSRGVGIHDFKKEKPWRPRSIILEVDPPEHARTRAVLSRILSVKALTELQDRFRLAAEFLVDNLVNQGRIDGVRDLAVAFPINVFPDAVGLASGNRENLLRYGHMVFNMLGPQNAIAKRAMEHAETVIPWITEQCRRENLSNDGFGAQIYANVDDGDLSEEEASLLVRSLLSAGLDTTVLAIGNALHCFAEHPDQWQKFREDPGNARFAFEEVMRYEPPLHSFYRTADKSTEISGIPIAEGDKVLLNIASANQDPRRWENPDVFDISRKPVGHVAFGVGIHACVGRTLATMEAQAIFGALVKKVKLISPTGDAILEPSNTLHGYATLPIELIA